MSTFPPEPVRYAALTAAFRSYFGLTGAGSRLLALLYLTRQAKPEQMMFAAGVSSRHSCTVLLSQVRQVMEVEAVDYTKDRGHYLTDIGLAECGRAVAEMREALAA